jgi:hypothetical protein
MEMASVVERFGDSCELRGAEAESEGATELEARVAPILHGVGDWLEESLGQRFEKCGEELGAGNPLAGGLEKGDSRVL